MKPDQQEWIEWCLSGRDLAYGHAGTRRRDARARSAQPAVLKPQHRFVELGPTPLVYGDPRHPYTKTLLASVPQLHRKWDQIERGNGSAAAVDGGGLVEVATGHFVAELSRATNGGA